MVRLCSEFMGSAQVKELYMEPEICRPILAYELVS